MGLREGPAWDCEKARRGSVEEARAEPVDTQGCLVAVSHLLEVNVRHRWDVLQGNVRSRRSDNVLRERIQQQAKPGESIGVRLSGLRPLRQLGRERGVRGGGLISGFRSWTAGMVVPKTGVRFARLTPERGDARRAKNRRTVWFRIWAPGVVPSVARALVILPPPTLWTWRQSAQRPTNRPRCAEPTAFCPKTADGWSLRRVA